MNNTYFWRKLHSFSGIMPLGVFLFEHFFTNSFALRGAGAFNNAVKVLHSLPYLWLAEVLLIYLPLLYHGLYGLVVLMQPKNNVLHYGYYRNWMFYFQRVTALVTFGFLVWHVATLRFGAGNAPDGISFLAVQAVLSNTAFFVLYFVGLVAAVFHFTNGISTFLITWGITTGEGAQKMTLAACWAVFIALCSVGLRFMFAFVS